jgi:hypothetical protein
MTESRQPIANLGDYPKALESLKFRSFPSPVPFRCLQSATRINFSRFFQENSHAKNLRQIYSCQKKTAIG